jgi:2-amino-4-hydroxy-6-hydroxymethyldihydropteridine diphosphokinase
MKNRVYLSLGTNLGNRQSNLLFAIAQIEKYAGTIVSQSSVYATAPWGFESDHHFLNMALAIDTDLDPASLLIQLKQIEIEAGRITQTTLRYEDRLLDIDLLLFNDLILHTHQLEIPHPRLHLRNFVLVPLDEIAPNLIHPALKKTINALLSVCPDTNIVHSTVIG